MYVHYGGEPRKESQLSRLFPRLFAPQAVIRSTGPAPCVKFATETSLLWKNAALLDNIRMRALLPKWKRFGG
jgi:hypothetical protein